MINLSTSLEVSEGLQYQTSTEIIPYSVTTTNWISVPTLPVVACYDETDQTDVTATVFPVNVPTVLGDVITLSPLKLLTKGHTYRVEVSWTVGVAKYECYFRVACEL
jgi:hypothetical protein